MYLQAAFHVQEIRAETIVTNFWLPQRTSHGFRTKRWEKGGVIIFALEKNGFQNEKNGKGI
jgi:hypothetical protein